MTRKEFYDWTSKRWAHLSPDDARFLTDKAIMFYYGYWYKGQSVDEASHPINGFVEIAWVQSCIEVLVNRNGVGSAVAYSENGLSMEFDRSDLPLSLLNMIPNRVRTI